VPGTAVPRGASRKHSKAKWVLALLAFPWPFRFGACVGPAAGTSSSSPPSLSRLVGPGGYPCYWGRWPVLGCWARERCRISRVGGGGEGGAAPVEERHALPATQTRKHHTPSHTLWEERPKQTGQGPHSGPSSLLLKLPHPIPFPPLTEGASLDNRRRKLRDKAPRRALHPPPWPFVSAAN